MRRVISAATVAIAVAGIAGHGHTAGSTRSVTPARAASTAHEPTITHETTTTLAPTTTTRPKPPAAAPTTVRTVPHPTPTSKPAPPPVDPAKLLRTCLDLAAANNLRAVNANSAWYQRQLRSYAGRKKQMYPARYNALLIEEDQSRSVIDAQRSIDVANCYIKNAS